jgi:hypothetical protein
VQRDFDRSWFTRLPLLFGSLFEALRGGVIAKLFRLNWHFAGFVIYPWVALIGIGLALLGIGFGIAGLISWLLPLSGAAKALLACAIAAGLLWALKPKLKQAYVYHLLDGWIFSWQLAAGRRPEFEGRLDAFLREDDLDAAVLRLAHAVGGRNALVVLAAAADHHLLARYAEPGQGVGDVVGAPLGEPLVVAGRARGVGVAGHLDLHRGRAGGFRRLLHDPHPVRGDRVAIPIEEHQEHAALTGGGGGGGGGATTGGGGGPNR